MAKNQNSLLLLTKSIVAVAISTCKPDALDRIWDSSVWQNYFSVNQLLVTISVNKLTHRLANCVEA